MRKQHIVAVTAFVSCLLTAVATWGADNGTVTINGLVWLKDASCLGKQDWNSATSIAQSLSAANAPAACNLKDGSVAGKWRLPTYAELSSVSGRSSGQFSNVQYANYWTSTAASAPGYYNVIFLKTAELAASSGSSLNYFLAVRNP